MPALYWTEAAIRAKIDALLAAGVSLSRDNLRRTGCQANSNRLQRIIDCVRTELNIPSHRTPIRNPKLITESELNNVCRQLLNPPGRLTRKTLVALNLPASRKRLYAAIRRNKPPSQRDRSERRVQQEECRIDRDPKGRQEIERRIREAHLDKIIHILNGGIDTEQAYFG